MEKKLPVGGKHRATHILYFECIIDLRRLQRELDDRVYVRKSNGLNTLEFHREHRSGRSRWSTFIQSICGGFADSRDGVVLEIANRIGNRLSGGQRGIRRKESRQV